jgi:hypothetical protein
MQNFGKIKNVFNNLLIEGIVKKDKTTKQLFKKYVKSLKENEILKTQFLMFNNIENKFESDAMMANIYVSENIKLLDKFLKKDIIKANKKLVTILGDLSSRLNEDYENSELHESITKLIFTERSPKTIDVLTEETKKITSHIKKDKVKNTQESIDLPTSVLMKMMVEKYNERYSTLNENDKQVLKTLINSNLDDKQKIYHDSVNECVKLIDKLLEESEAPKDKLLSVRAKLLENTEVTNDDFIERFLKINELKSNLK